MLIRESMGLAEIDLGDPLGISLRKTVKRVKKKVKRVGRRAKKSFLKAAPILGVAAQALNLIVPGLGAAVGLAITSGAQALAAREAKKSARDQEELNVAREAEALYSAEAESRIHEAYLKGEKYFISRYRMDRERFMSLPLEEKYKFLMGTIFDRHEERFRAIGISRERFLSMTPNDQTALLERMNLESTFAPEAPSAGTIAIVAGSAIAILVAVYLLVMHRR